MEETQRSVFTSTFIEKGVCDLLSLTLCLAQSSSQWSMILGFRKQWEISACKQFLVSWDKYSSLVSCLYLDIWLSSRLHVSPLMLLFWDLMLEFFFSV